jgi:ribokinase
MRSAPTVIVVGSVNVDLVFELPTLPAAGETVTGGLFRRSAGGKGGNQASAAAKLGAHTYFIGRIGRDEHGQLTRAELSAAGVDTRWLTDSDQPTGVAAVLVGADGENLIGVASGANHDLHPDSVVAALHAIAATDAVVLASLEVPLPAVSAAAAVAAERGWTFMLNPAPASPLPSALIKATDVLTPNAHEATALGATDVAELLAIGAGAVVVTRGADGADLHRPGLPMLHTDAFTVGALDTTGAGDTFSGALAWALASGEALPAAVRTAAAAGALATQAMGARSGQPTAEEMATLLSDN